MKTYPTFTHRGNNRIYTAYILKNAFSRSDGGEAIVFHPKGLPRAGMFPEPIEIELAQKAWNNLLPNALYFEGRDMIYHVHPETLEVLESIPLVN